MAALTWRNVEAPDFRSSMDGLNQASQMLNNAFSGLNQTLVRADGAQTERANSQIMAEIVAAQDADAAKALAASVGERFDPRRVDAATWSALAARPGALTQQAASENALDWTQGRQARTLQTEGNTDAARALRNEVQRLSSMGKTTEAQALLARPENAALMGNLSYDESSKTYGDMLGTRRENLSYEQGVWGFGKNKTEWDWTQTDRTTAQLADKLAGEFAGMSADPLDAERLIQERGLDGRTANAVRQRMGLPFFPAGGGSAGSVGGGGVTGVGAGFSMGAPQQAVASVFEGAGLSAPVIAGFLGNFHVEGGYGGATGDNGSAAGIAQWRGDRRQNFVKMFGVDPSKGTPEQQAKFVVWELSNPTAAGMTSEQVSKIKAAKTPAEAASLIDQHYERSSGQHRTRRQEFANSAMQMMAPQAIAAAAQGTNLVNQASMSGDMTTRVVQRAQEQWSNLGTASAMAAALVGEGGAYAGGNKDDVLDKINDIAAQFKVSPAVAASIFEDAAKGSSLFSLNDWMNTATSNYGGRSFDNERIAALGGALGNTNVLRNVAGNIYNRNTEMGAVQTAQQTLAAAQAALAAKVQLAQRTGRRLDTTAEERAVTAAHMQFELSQRTADVGSGAPVTPSRGPYAPDVSGLLRLYGR